AIRVGQSSTRPVVGCGTDWTHMRCTGCGTENANPGRFCQACGVPLERHCAACGAPLALAAKFCSECGRPAGAGAVVTPGPPPPRLTTPSLYTPRYLSDRILASRTALEGERKQVTVLFADVQGSMQMLAERDPEEALEVLDPVLELMMEAVHWY